MHTSEVYSLMGFKNLNPSLENSSQSKAQNSTSPHKPYIALFPVTTPRGDHYPNITHNVFALSV